MTELTTSGNSRLAPGSVDRLVFEFPLAERVRGWLRLEEQFRRAKQLALRRDALDHRAALLALFEILDTATRSDLKSDLLHELDRQRLIWSTQAENPEIEQGALSEFLRDLDTVLSDLHAQVGRPGQHLRDIDWLVQVRQRAASPSGVCTVELPMLGAWLAQPEALRKADLQRWLEPFSPLEEAITLLLRLLRESGVPCAELAHLGSFQRSLDGTRAPLLAIVRVDAGWAAVPELSANRYMINIRWLEHGGHFMRSGRATASTRDIPFELTLCRL
ncbi:MAG: cell division protein ZapD [Casimicrobiaceae bacterium]|nr:cell division protein ZapD [Casimicrobiaceae bacterium]MCX8098489.1 cell division protein ZapD [Casimicrobiaceae bacterium]MDW8311592.1 cell division protein ZapD [Burkholderiales bacterium]